MKKAFSIIITIFLLTSCSDNDKTASDDHNSSTKTKTPDSTNQAMPTDPAIKLDSVLKINNGKTLTEITKFLDSLLGNNNHQHRIDTVTDWELNKEKHYEMGPRALNLVNLESYYAYAGFHFLYFKNKTSAKKQFDLAVKTGTHKGGGPFVKDSVPLYWYMFSKGGSAFFLYDSLIIYRHRRCNFDDRKEIPNEEKLLSYLYNDKFPNHHYFIRTRCGWSDGEIK